MNYSDISIIHLEKGLDIFYNCPWTHNSNQSNKEIIFFFDKNKNFIQKTTYSLDIHSEYIPNMVENVSSRICISDECFFYYSFYYQVSYAHYLTQCLPKIKYYMDDMSKILVVPRSTYNQLCKDIFNLLNIPNEKILILEDNIEYIFSDITVIEHIGKQWDGVGGEINYDGIEVYKKIRNSYGVQINSRPHRKVYLKRSGSSNYLYGNGEVGIFRKIDNENELIKFLKGRGFEIVELGSKSINEKFYEMRDIHTLITQIGSNFMNIIFCNSVKNVLLLSNDFPLGLDYYFGIIDILNPIEHNKDIFTYSSSIYGADPKNHTNNPFKVDIDQIDKYLQRIE